MKQVEHTLNEKRVMASISFPFLISLDYHFKVGERRVWQEKRREEGGVEDGCVEGGRRGGRFCNGRTVLLQRRLGYRGRAKRGSVCGGMNWRS